MRQEGISQGLKTILLGVLNARAKEGAEKVATEEKSVPQRLKPHYKRGTYGTAEAVPLSETRLLQHPLKPGPTSEAMAVQKQRQCRSNGSAEATAVQKQRQCRSNGSAEATAVQKQRQCE